MDEEVYYFDNIGNAQ
jgi:hypothetical protein